MPRPTPRAYTQAQKAEAVGLASVTSQKHAAESLGIPRRTLGQWVNDPQWQDLRDASRDQLATQMWVGIQIGLAEVVKDIQGEAPLRDKATALGILYDKHALLTGAATARTESRDLTGTLSDLDLINALREADAITGEGGTAPAPAGEAAGE